MADGDTQEFDSLATERIAYEGLAAVQEAGGEREKGAAIAALILAIFDDYHKRSDEIPWLAKRAFETRDWPEAVRLARERLAIYRISIANAAPILKLAIREADATGRVWQAVEETFGTLVANRYEADLALAYLASIRRWVYHDMWEPIPYDFGKSAGAAASDALVRTFWPEAGRMTPEIVRQVIAVADIEAPFRNLEADSEAVAERVNSEFGLGDAGGHGGLDRVEAIAAGFFRNRGGYVIGCLEMQGQIAPLALAMLNGPDGVYVDAVILRESTLRHVFSSTLANFHATLTDYHGLVDYLHRLMSARPRGLHYSTVGYHHVGKMAVMRQLHSDLGAAEETFDHAPGPRGSVAIGFTAPSTGYVAKVIRDRPTENYKWERFDGIDSVLAKYRQVHELNRSGSMLDNIMYQNVAVARDLFSEALLEDLLQEASCTVALWRDEVIFRHLIVQHKMTPVPLYLANCGQEEAELVVIRLGQCIRNNAATGVFNRDLDGRNYGVSDLRFVYLFDYDAILPLGDVKVRTNLGREDGEEDIPDWFFEEGPVFLPEEMEAHLRLPTKHLRRLFREAHGELLTAEWWERMQRWLTEGRVPKVRTYPRSVQLDRDVIEANLTLRRPT